MSKAIDNRFTNSINAANVPVLADTGKRVNGCEFGENILPLFTGNPGGYDGIAQLPDGRYVYAIDDNAAGYTSLYEEAVAMDAGDNVVRRRVAGKLQTLEGLTAPTVAERGLNKIGAKQVGWLKQG